MVSVVQVQSALDIAQSNAMAARAISSSRIEPDPAILHAYFHLLAVSPDVHHKGAVRLHLRQPVNICILNDRLKKHAWNQRIVKLWINTNGLFYATAYRCPCIEGTIRRTPSRPRKEIIALIAMFQRHTQQTAQLFQHGVRGVDIAAHKLEMPFIVLNRKCGFNCIRRRQSAHWRAESPAPLWRLMLPKALIISNTAKQTNEHQKMSMLSTTQHKHRLDSLCQ